MPLTLTVGLSKKIGLPDYGSLGVSCNVQVELDSTLLQGDLGAFHERVKRAYLACHQAVSDELGRQQQLAPASGQGTNPSARRNGALDSGHGQSNGQARSGRKATASQVRAIASIATRQRLDLPALLQQQFSTDQLAALTVTQASDLIDQLKQRSSNHGGRA